MSKILTISLREYNLKPAQIDNLASEYYGRILPLTNHEDDKEMDIEFPFNEEFSAQTLAANFLVALNNFKEKKE